ncbi:MAG: ATP-binding protein [Marinilabiliales bacterium]|nr:ATP-binding protein [Marinilabiliales bacterium]
MSLSIAPFLITLSLSDRLRKQSKSRKLPHWEKFYRNTFFVSLFLLVTDIVVKDNGIMPWIWILYLGFLLVMSQQEKEFRTMRMFLLAFVPYAVVSFVSTFSEGLLPDFYNAYESYFKSGESIAIIWWVAMLFSMNRQDKIAEKERIKRLREDEINRAIAIRKVELEGLVAERTAELTRQKEELEETLSELKNTQSQLIQSEKMASLGELTAGIAHEIQNPLNFVNNFSEVSNELLVEMEEEMEQGNVEEVRGIITDLKSNLEKINHHGKRADSIVKGMLLHSRAGSGQKEPTDINALADEYLRLAYHGLRAKDKSFNSAYRTELDPAIGKVNVVPQDLGRVILNLLTNAFYVVSEKKKREGAGYEPEVVVKTEKREASLLITVSDNGDGIPSKILDKIFQPFFTTKPAGKGTGLGLSMCYEIVTQGHGGELKVETEEGRGSVFTILLPIETPTKA